MKKKTSVKPKKTVAKKNSTKKTVKPVAAKQSVWQNFSLWLHSKLSSLALWK
jgi:hypothetical protein